jgi:putative ABC transport system permease protein
LGATISSIVKLFSREHILLVLTANIVSWPLAYYYINNWLENFTNRVDINLSVFIFVGVLSIIMTIVVVSFQSIRAAIANPVDAIKYE